MSLQMKSHDAFPIPLPSFLSIYGTSEHSPPDITDWHVTPASSLWLQSRVWEEYVQLVSLDSVPRHPTLSNSIGIVPWPKKAPVRAMEPAGMDLISILYIFSTFYQLMRILAVYRQLEHPLNSINHHTLCPIYHWHRPPLDLHGKKSRQQALLFHWCRLKRLHSI